MSCPSSKNHSFPFLSSDEQDSGPISILSYAKIDFFSDMQRAAEPANSCLNPTERFGTEWLNIGQRTDPFGLSTVVRRSCEQSLEDRRSRMALKLGN